MVSNLLKRWQDDFATVKRRRDGFGLFEKKWDAILPHLKHCIYSMTLYPPSYVFVVCILVFF
jgi:hypothetical protein